MTPHEMRIAAAESAGWTPHSVRDVKSMWYRPGEKFKRLERTARIPEYDRDLNAVVALIETLEVGHDGSDAANYQETLYGIVNPGRDFVEDFCAGADVAYLQAMLLATPLQQLEAYLKVKELWK
jgi:hypothetical protein